MEVSIDLGRGLTDKIRVYDEDDVDDLVTAFCSKHNISPIVKPRLVEEINTKLTAPYSDSMQSPHISSDDSSVSSSHVSDDDTISITSNESFVMASGKMSYFDFDLGAKILTCKQKSVQSASNTTSKFKIIKGPKKKVAKNEIKRLKLSLKADLVFNTPKKKTKDHKEEAKSLYTNIKSSKETYLRSRSHIDNKIERIRRSLSYRKGKTSRYNTYKSIYNLSQTIKAFKVKAQLPAKLLLLLKSKGLNLKEFITKADAIYYKMTSNEKQLLVNFYKDFMHKGHSI